jgi:hypothetical protein
VRFALPRGRLPVQGAVTRIRAFAVTSGNAPLITALSAGGIGGLRKLRDAAHSGRVPWTEPTVRLRAGGTKSKVGEAPLPTVAVGALYHVSVRKVVGEVQLGP